MSSLNCFTSEAGSIEQELSFDARSLSACWRSNRRDPATWQNLSSAPSGLITDRGYTGHLHLDGFKLINMGGRVYDPVLGRFLSPDNFVQDAGSTQDYNRYSYCGNNPLIYSDPSGWIKIPQMPNYDNGSDHPGGASGSGDYSIFPKYGYLNSPSNDLEWDIDFASNLYQQTGLMGGAAALQNEIDRGFITQDAIKYEKQRGFGKNGPLKISYSTTYRADDGKGVPYLDRSDISLPPAIAVVEYYKFVNLNFSLSDFKNSLPYITIRDQYNLLMSPFLSVEAFSSSTVSGNSPIEITKESNGKVLSVAFRGQFSSMSLGSDGSIIAGNSILSLGSDMYGNLIIELGIPVPWDNRGGVTLTIDKSITKGLFDVGGFFLIRKIPGVPDGILKPIFK